jgi:hypothetical protein
MELSLKQGEAVIKIHEIARFVDSNLSKEIAEELRNIAHRLDQLKPTEDG